MYKSGKMQGSDSQVDYVIGVQDSVQEASAFHWIVHHGRDFLALLSGG